MSEERTVIKIQAEFDKEEARDLILYYRSCLYPKGFIMWELICHFLPAFKEMIDKIIEEE